MSYYMSRTQFPSLTNSSNSNLVSICSLAAYKEPCQAASHLMPMALFEEDAVLILPMKKCRAQNLDKVTYTGHAGTGIRFVINSFPRVL